MRKKVRMGIFATLLLTGCALPQITNELTIELGSPNKITEKDFLKEKGSNAKLDMQLPKVFNEIKEYKGKIKIPVLFQLNKEEAITIKVQDTTKPNLKKDFPKEIRVEQNAEGIEWSKYFQDTDGNCPYAEDLQPIKVSVQNKNVNLSKEGEYSITVIVQDKSGNRSEKEVKVVVIASKMVQKGQGSELTPYRTGYTPISEQTEKLVVEKGLKINSPIVNGKVCKKGQYSTDKKQKEYKTRLKKLAEEERKRKEKEKAEQERIVREQAELEWQAQQQTPVVQNTPTTVYGGNKTQSRNTTQRTQKPKTQTQTQKPVVQKPSTINSGGGQQTQKPSTSSGCVAGALPANSFYTRKEAGDYAQNVIFDDMFNGGHKIKSYNSIVGEDKCGNVMFTITFNYY